MSRKYENFGKALRDIRMSRGYSQVDLAKMLGHGSSQFLSNTERGICILPKPAMKKIVTALKVSRLDRAYILDSICMDREIEEREKWKGVL